jgi:2-polyprenyl-6-methoxyphenol hydroxylase-like FAD-dependent oxidoreductase
LARAGIDVVVLEKHADFLRAFRGDTIHPLNPRSDARTQPARRPSEATLPAIAAAQGKSERNSRGHHG